MGWIAMDDQEKKALLIAESQKSSLTEGWIDRAGHFYRCRKGNHESYAHLVLDSNGRILEQIGWVKVYSFGRDREWFCHWRITVEQAQVLTELGFENVEDNTTVS